LGRKQLDGTSRPSMICFLLLLLIPFLPCCNGVEQMGSWKRPETWTENLEYMKSNFAEFGYFNKKAARAANAVNAVKSQLKDKVTAEEIFDLDGFISVRGLLLAIFYLCVIDPRFYLASFDSLMTRSTFSLPLIIV
jgi:hypothetical protein